MYSATETVGLELKYTAKDQLRGGLASARGTLTKFSSFAHGIADKVAAGFKRMWAAALNPTSIMLGGVAVGGGLLAVKNYLQGAVRIAGEWEGYLAKLTVALKSATKAKEMFEWAKQFAATTPFEMGEVVDATTRLELYGLTAKKWLPLVGDMAGAMGRSITDAVEAVADAISGGGLERLKEFGITSTVLLKYGAKPGAAGGVSYMGEDAIERLKKAIIAVMSERYGGGMTKLLATWMGKTSNLADAWSQIKGRIGEGMMPVLKKIVDKTTEWLNLLLKSEVGEKIGKKLGEWIDWAWKKAQGFVNYLIENWPTIRKTLEETWENIKAKITAVVDKAKEWLGTSEKIGAELGKTGAELGKIGPTLDSVRTAADNVTGSMDKLKAIGYDLKGLWGTLKLTLYGVVYAFWGLAEVLNVTLELMTRMTPAGKLVYDVAALLGNQDPFGFKAAQETARAQQALWLAKGQEVWEAIPPVPQKGVTAAGRPSQLQGSAAAALPTATATPMPTAYAPRYRPSAEAEAFSHRQKVHDLKYEMQAEDLEREAQGRRNRELYPMPVTITNPNDIHRAGKGADRARQSSAGTEFSH